MRAGRLVSLVLLLQNRGGMNATELAEALEVSVRTIYRDVESLSAAGIPIYADQGRAGGYRLLEGYRTTLTGLTSREAQALFLAGTPDAAAQLGLGATLASAEEKVVAALPAAVAPATDRIRQRFHLDATGWFREPDDAPDLAVIAAAVWDQRRMEVRYRRWNETEPVDRVIEPLGVVVKAGIWYAVVQVDGGLRVYRASKIQVVRTLDAHFERPSSFDLASYWRDWAEQYERRMLTGTATVRLAPGGLARVRGILGPIVADAAAESASEPDADGWITTTLPIERFDVAHDDLLRLGGSIEVLAPAELRERLAATGERLVRLYAVRG